MDSHINFWMILSTNNNTYILLLKIRKINICYIKRQVFLWFFLIVIYVFIPRNSRFVWRVWCCIDLMQRRWQKKSVLKIFRSSIVRDFIELLIGTNMLCFLHNIPNMRLCKTMLRTIEFSSNLTIFFSSVMYS